jgi:Na+/phosphate symporter
MKRFYKFLIQTAIVAVLLFMAGYFFFKNNDLIWYHIGFLYVLIGYLLFSWIIQYALYTYVQKRLAVFNRAFMLITGIKLVALIIAMLVLAVVIPHLFKYFLGEILILYLLFSIVEIRDILSFAKEQK